MNKSEPNPTMEFRPEDFKLIQAIQEMQKAQAELLKAVTESSRLMQQVVAALGKAQKQTHEALLAVVRVIPGKREALELSQAIKAARAAKNTEEEAAARKHLEKKWAIYERKNPRDASEPTAVRAGDGSPLVPAEEGRTPEPTKETPPAPSQAEKVAASPSRRQEALPSYLEAAAGPTALAQSRADASAPPGPLQKMREQVDNLLEECHEGWPQAIDSLERLARRLEKHQPESASAELEKATEQARERWQSLARLLISDLEAIDVLLSGRGQTSGSNLPPPDIAKRLRQLRGTILEFVGQHGEYEEYSPPLGDDPARHDCEHQPEPVETRSYRSGQIAQIVTPGYRKRCGDGWEPIVQPRIRVAR